MGAERAEGVENNFCVTGRKRSRFEKEAMHSVCGVWLLAECTHVQVGSQRPLEVRTQVSK